MTKTCAMSCSCIDHYYDSYFNSCCNEFRTVIGGWFGLKWCTLISSKKKRADALFLLPILPLFPLCFWAEMELLKVTHSRLGCFQLDKDVSVLQGTKVVHTQKPQKSECNEISYVQVVNKREISSSQAESRQETQICEYIVHKLWLFIEIKGHGQGWLDLDLLKSSITVIWLRVISDWNRGYKDLIVDFGDRENQRVLRMTKTQHSFDLHLFSEKRVIIGRVQFTAILQNVEMVEISWVWMINGIIM